LNNLVDVFAAAQAPEGLTQKNWWLESVFHPSRGGVRMMNIEVRVLANKTATPLAGRGQSEYIRDRGMLRSHWFVVSCLSGWNWLVSGKL
jgi:hypothetical protein